VGQYDLIHTSPSRLPETLAPKRGMARGNQTPRPPRSQVTVGVIGLRYESNGAARLPPHTDLGPSRAELALRTE